MNWTVDNIYKAYLKLARKNQAGGISATDFFYYWNIEQNMYYQDIVGRWQTRANGKTGNNTGLIQNENILSELSDFTLPAIITINQSGTDPTVSSITKPTDFFFRLACRINGYKVSFLNHDQIDSAIRSVIDPPSVTDNKYYAVEYENYYSLFPNTLPTLTITTAELDYVATCDDVVWGFTFDAGGRQVYNPGTSVQPKWKTPTVITITKRALVQLGISFKDSDFLNAGRQAQATGD